MPDDTHYHSPVSPVIWAKYPRNTQSAFQNVRIQKKQGPKPLRLSNRLQVVQAMTASRFIHSLLPLSLLSHTTWTLISHPLNACTLSSPPNTSTREPASEIIRVWAADSIISCQSIISPEHSTYKHSHNPLPQYRVPISNTSTILHDIHISIHPPIQTLPLPRIRPSDQQR